MRLIINPSLHRVYLDGEQVSDVRQADTSAGWIEVYETEGTFDDQPVYTYAVGGARKTERRYGRVEVHEVAGGRVWR